MSETDLPVGWARVTLGDIRRDDAKRVIPGDTPDEQFELFSIPSFPTGRAEVVRGADIGSDKQSVVPGTVLVSKINPRINRVWVARPHTEHRVIASTEWVPFFPVDAVSPHYLAHYLRRDDFREYLATNVSGVGGSLMRVRPVVMERYPLPLPPPAEQRRIVAALEEHLSDLDAAVAGLERARANVARFRAALLELAVRPGSDISCDAWKSTTLGAVTDIQGGIQKQPKRAPIANHHPFLRVANVHRGRLVLDDIHRVELFGEELNRLRLIRDDLLIVEGNGSPNEIGRMALWDGSIENCVHQNHIIRARATGRVHPPFLAHYWNSPTGARLVRAAASSTSGLHTLSVAKVAQIMVPIPPLSVQIAIVAEIDHRLTVADRTAADIDVQLARAARLRQSILQRAFSGRLVPQDPADEPAAALLARIRAELTAAPARAGRRGTRNARA